MDDRFDLPLAVRSAEASDIPFLYSSWLHSLRDNDPYRKLDRNVYFAAFHALFTRLINRSVTLVACSVHNSDQIYGFCIAEPEADEALLHWLYTKSASKGVGPGYRRAGVATRLLEAMFPLVLGAQPITATLWTSSAARLPDRWLLRVNTHKLCERSAI
jgi:hypothetical protein